ncbi:uncharacterized protein LOC128581134 [Nycticebus coucang]|uniref:uncharacterized protein LOC128581134 n=1 Tax=Nycticebus coucang TaxID=9470 RepID=UPI00234C9028|nr:uncharacterized protein LOC128581134 [Nycticebus coucang]
MFLSAPDPQLRHPAPTQPRSHSPKPTPGAWRQAGAANPASCIPDSPVTPLPPVPGLPAEQSASPFSAQGTSVSWKRQSASDSLSAGVGEGWLRDWLWDQAAYSMCVKSFLRQEGIQPAGVLAAWGIRETYLKCFTTLRFLERIVCPTFPAPRKSRVIAKECPPWRWPLSLRIETILTAVGSFPLPAPHLVLWGQFNYKEMKSVFQVFRSSERFLRRAKSVVLFQSY